MGYGQQQLFPLPHYTLRLILCLLNIPAVFPFASNASSDIRREYYCGSSSSHGKQYYLQQHILPCLSVFVKRLLQCFMLVSTYVCHNLRDALCQFHSHYLLSLLSSLYITVCPSLVHCLLLAYLLQHIGDGIGNVNVVTQRVAYVFP